MRWSILNEVSYTKMKDVEAEDTADGKFFFASGRLVPIQDDLLLREKPMVLNRSGIREIGNRGL